MNRISIANRGSPRGKTPPRNRGPTRHRRGPPDRVWKQKRRYELGWSRLDQGGHPESLQPVAYRHRAKNRIPPELANAANALTIRNRRRPKHIREGPSIGRPPPKATGPPIRGDPSKGEGRNNFDSPNPGQGRPNRRLAEISVSHKPSRRK